MLSVKCLFFLQLMLLMPLLQLSHIVKLFRGSFISLNRDLQPVRPPQLTWVEDRKAPCAHTAFLTIDPIIDMKGWEGWWVLVYGGQIWSKVNKMQPLLTEGLHVCSWVQCLHVWSRIWHQTGHFKGNQRTDLWPFTSLKGLFQIYIFKNPTLMTLYKGSFEGDAQRMINISSLKALWRTPFILSLREINKELWSRDTEALLLLILPFSL